MQRSRSLSDFSCLAGLGRFRVFASERYLTATFRGRRNQTSGDPAFRDIWIESPRKAFLASSDKPVSNKHFYTQAL